MLNRKLVFVDDLKVNFDLLKSNLFDSKSKFCCDFKDISNDIFRFVIFRVYSVDDFEFLVNFSKNNGFDIFAIEIKSNLLSVLDFSLLNINFLRVYVISYDDIFKINNYVSKFCFLEFVISYDLFSKFGFFNINNRVRVIIEFNKPIFYDEFNKLDAKFISNRMFLFTKGIPFCFINNDAYFHCVELYNYFGFYNYLEFVSRFDAKFNGVDSSCSNCVFTNFCCKNSNFSHKVIFDDSSIADVLKFLKNERINDKF